MSPCRENCLKKAQAKAHDGGLDQRKFDLACCTAGNAHAEDYGQGVDMGTYSEMPFMENAGMPADDPPSHSPDKQPGGRAEDGSTAGIACDAARVPACGSAAAADEDASKGSADVSGATPIASRTVQQLVRIVPVL
jgi:hypothetical protein